MATDTITNPTADGRKRRGFASMTPERRQEIARLGGAAVPNEKRSFSQNTTLVREAGRKGGSNSHLARLRQDS